MIFIHAADIHLGSQLAALDRSEGLPADLVRAAPLVALRRIAELSAEREAQLLLIAGDLFDTNAPLSVLLEATDVLKRIAADGTHVVMIRGNHDAQSKLVRNLPQIERVHQLSSEQPETLVLDLPGGRVAIHGRGFDAPVVTDNIVLSYPPRVDGAYNIGLLHTSLEGNAAHATYAPCSVDDLVARGYDYWALGHIHQHEVVRDTAPTIVYAGSPQARHVNETGEHGAYVVRIEHGELTAAPEHVELASIQWHHVRVDIEEGDAAIDVDGVVALVRTQLDAIAQSTPDVRHIARVTVSGRCAAHVEMLLDPEAFRDQVYLTAGAISVADVHVERVRVRTSPPLPDPQVLHDRPDAIGALAAHLDGLLLHVREDDGAGTTSEDDEAGHAPALPPAIVKVNERLQKLGAEGHDLVATALDVTLVEQARDDLLAQLVARSMGAEAGGDAR